jgi:hypothetical protein
MEPLFSLRGKLGFREKPFGELWPKKIVSCCGVIRLQKGRKTEQAVDLLHEREGRGEAEEERRKRKRRRWRGKRRRKE